MAKRKIIVALILAMLPLLARAQDDSQDSGPAPEATTRPAQMSSGPDTRPSEGSTRYENYRSSRRRRTRSTESIAATPAVLPAIYDVVSGRNIFIKGNQHPAPPVNVAPSTPFDPNNPYRAAANQLVLTGVSLEGNTKVAFLEDQQAYTVKRVQVGDPIADGKVVNMTLDALDYKDHNGNTIRVAVGFNLAGGDVWGSASDSGSPGASTRPSIIGPRAPGESMEDYLRRRRAAEESH